jgi:gamma-glutamyltranspeptidase/glutathione hydrolase
MHKALYLLTLFAVSFTCTAASPAPEPEPGPWTPGAMAAAANPHAVEAAMTMLRRGGHAVDAAIAAHAVLGLVEPQSSGIGGGAFLLVYQRAEDALVFLDGRESAPAGSRKDMFMRDGEVMKFTEAWQSGVSVGVPGAVALYETAHQRFGKLPWADLFQPAIELATQGFEVSPRLAGMLPTIAKMGRLDEDPGSAGYFFPGGSPLQPGQLLKNPELAKTLSRIAKEGSDAFYRGEIAEAMVAAARRAPHPGSLSLEDIAAYRVIQRDAVCGSFRDLQVCGPTPPSSAAAQIMMLTIYDHLLPENPSRADEIVAFVDAQRLAYADRDHFFGDPDAVPVPLDELLRPEYLAARAKQRFAPGDIPVHGDPFLAAAAGVHQGFHRGPDRTEEVAGTSHLSIVDGEGNAVSMTATVEAPFGSSRWAEGFLMNNQLTDFSREYHPGEAPQANAIAPGKRPRSSMSPMIVFDAEDRLKMVTGSPGGNSIPGYVFKSLVGVFDWGMTLQDAVDFPNIVARGEKVYVETKAEPGSAIAEDLAARGYKLKKPRFENSGLHVILVEGETLKGAADPRREGTVGSLPR